MTETIAARGYVLPKCASKTTQEQLSVNLSQEQDESSYVSYFVFQDPVDACP